MKHAEQLRHAIDQGLTGDKVRHLDPAAAPLGTDEEAAGTPIRPSEVEAAWQAERKPDLGNRDAGRDASHVYSADEVRQGEIILKRPWQRMVFIAGLAGAVLLALILRFAGAY